MFFGIYFGHYAKYRTADFQKEMFAITEDETIKNAVIVAFRGSAKSTIMSLSYPIWSILGKQEKKFVLLLSQTQNQARQLMSNLKQELESNALLRQDLGPFQEPDDEWRFASIVLPKYNARITAVSTEQSIRGIRHGVHRPDLIICDDIEDLNSVKTRGGRNKIYRWFSGDVVPAGDENTRVIVIGNLLHEDSMIMRLKENIENKSLDGVFRNYPIFLDNKTISWPGKFPSMEKINSLKRNIGDERAWQREYLLRIVSEEDQVVYPEWIHYYDELPDKKAIRMVLMGVDLAISKKENADCSAIISAVIADFYDEAKIFILPSIINRRMNFPETIRQIEALYKANEEINRCVDVLVEDVGYQRAVTEQLREKDYEAFNIKVSSDKRSRLITATPLLQNKRILFPKKGAEELIRQLVGFGMEKHDDLADAFTLIAHRLTKESPPDLVTCDEETGEELYFG